MTDAESFYAGPRSPVAPSGPADPQDFGLRVSFPSALRLETYGERSAGEVEFEVANAMRERGYRVR